MTSPFELRSLLRSEIADGEREVVRLTDEQLYTLNMLRGMRRAAVVGGAGTGKTMLAMAKAAPARERGVRDPARLLQLAARAGRSRTRPGTWRERTGRLDVSTFHQLAEDLASRGGHAAAEAGPGHPGVVRATTLPRGAR